tara:strand:- start:112 stop:321 length:210 start_codon:yes stop_codon:yes gene_type:complete
MTNNILLSLIVLSFIGVILSCLATVQPSYGYNSHANVEVVTSEIEIEFVPTTHIEVPSNEIEIIFVADK